MLGQRRRRWANIQPTLFQRIVPAGYLHPVLNEWRLVYLDLSPDIRWTNSSDFIGYFIFCQILLLSFSYCIVYSASGSLIYSVTRPMRWCDCIFPTARLDSARPRGV